MLDNTEMGQTPAGLGSLARFVPFQVRLWRYCAQRLHDNNLTAMAAALSFHTIFALIPTLVLVLLTLSSLGLLEVNKQSLRNFLVASGFARIGVGGPHTPQQSAADTRDWRTPTSEPAEMQRDLGINVADEILGLVESVQGQLTIQRVGPIGIALFIWTAINLLSIMEDALNRVFGAARNRSVVRRSLMYWAVLTLGPVALAIALYFGQAAISAALGAPVLSAIARLLGVLGPTLVGILLLTATYVLLPNTIVHRQAALGGAFVAVMLWLVARWGFALYVGSFVVNGNLYGILGVLPLFLLWLYFSWLIFLFGAELAHTAANLKRLEVFDDSAPLIVTPVCAVRVVDCVLRTFQKGQGAADFSRICAETGISADALRWLLTRLVDRGVLAETGAEKPSAYLPAKPADQTEIREAWMACDSDSPEIGGPENNTAAQRLEARVRAALGSTTFAEDRNSPDRQ